MSTAEKPIRPASTIVLARPAPGGFEVLLMKRHSGSAFMPNMYVYPGGRVDEADCSAPNAACIDGLPTGGHIAASGAGPERVAGFYAAALRECFEEADVLLCGREPELTAAERAGWRERLHTGERDLAAFAEAVQVRFDATRLIPFSHWITPDFESRRFDTWFFLVAVSGSARARHDEVETVDSVWLRPSEALQQAAVGSIGLAPPTVCTLTLLAEQESIEAALEWAHRQVPVPTMPKLHDDDGVPTLLLPGDPLFPSDEAWVGRTRVQLVDGTWIWRSA